MGACGEVREDRQLVDRPHREVARDSDSAQRRRWATNDEVSDGLWASGERVLDRDVTTHRGDRIEEASPRRVDADTGEPDFARARHAGLHQRFVPACPPDARLERIRRTIGGRSPAMRLGSSRGSVEGDTDGNRVGQRTSVRLETEVWANRWRAAVSSRCQGESKVSHWGPSSNEVWGGGRAGVIGITACLQTYS